MRNAGTNRGLSMNNTTIFITQIVSILAYIGVLFGLYRLLVSQKDATIESLKEQNNLLREQLRVVESQTPLAVTESLERRIQLTEGEVNRLEEDLKKKNEAMEVLTESLVRAIELLEKREVAREQRLDG